MGRVKDGHGNTLSRFFARLSLPLPAGAVARGSGLPARGRTIDSVEGIEQLPQRFEVMKPNAEEMKAYVASRAR